MFVTHHLVRQQKESDCGGTKTQIKASDKFSKKMHKKFKLLC